MKNAVLNLIQVKLILLSFLFTGLFIFSSDLQAQLTIKDDLFSVPKGSFVDASTAISRLKVELTSIKNTLSNLNPNSQQFKEMDAKYAYYDKIRSILEEGKTFNSSAVNNAIAGGLSIFTTDTYGDFSLAIKQGYKQSAINLLKQ